MEKDMDMTKAQAAIALAENLLDCTAIQILRLPRDIRDFLVDYVNARAKAAQ